MYGAERYLRYRKWDALRRPATIRFQQFLNKKNERKDRWEGGGRLVAWFEGTIVALAEPATRVLYG